jgi:DNA polymerase III subunit epsilon
MLLNLERPLVFFDLETTGINIGRDRIVQVGLVTLLPDARRVSWQSLVDPQMPIPAEATNVHGITDMDVAGAPTLDKIADVILSQLKDCDLAGFNCLRFDVPFLAEELHRVGVEWDHTSARVVDVQRIYHRMEPRDLGAALRFYCDREHAGAHDALADVEATADVLLAQLERYPDKLHGSVDHLATLSGDRQRSPDAAGKLQFDSHGTICLSFGKYKGWSLENIGRSDPGYMQWLMTKAELPGSTLAVMRNTLAQVAS